MKDTDKMLLLTSLIDQMLDELPALSTFMKQEEYQKVDDFSKHLKSREWFLDSNFFKPINLTKENDTIPFEIELYTNPKSKQLSDSLAIIPFEFQYIRRDLPEFDIIVLRMFLDSKRFRIAIMEVSEDVIASFEENFKKVLKEKPSESSSNIFDEACYLCIQEYGERIFRTKGNVYESWNDFHNKIKEEMNISIKDYSDIGKYLWQTDYLRFDNRFRKKDKAITLVEQLETYKETLKTEIPTESHAKKGFSFKSIFRNKKDC